MLEKGELARYTCYDEVGDDSVSLSESFYERLMTIVVFFSIYTRCVELSVANIERSAKADAIM